MAKRDILHHVLPQLAMLLITTCAESSLFFLYSSFCFYSAESEQLPENVSLLYKMRVPKNVSLLYKMRVPIRTNCSASQNYSDFFILSRYFHHGLKST